MKRILFLLMLLLCLGCVQTPAQQGNRLELVAKDAPASASGVAYIDAKKLFAHPAVKENLNLSGAETFLPSLVSSIRIIGFEDGPVIVIEPSVPVSSFLPMLLKMIPNSAQEWRKEDYRGVELQLQDKGGYFVYDNLIYAGDTKRLKEIIDVKKGAPNALSKLSDLINETPFDDVMAVGVGMRIQEGVYANLSAHADLNPSSKNRVSLCLYVTSLPMPASTIKEMLSSQISSQPFVDLQTLDVSESKVSIIVLVDLKELIKQQKPMHAGVS